MTDLDEFAKAAMQGMLSHGAPDSTWGSLAEDCFALAEAMMAESRKRKEGLNMCHHGYVRGTCTYCRTMRDHVQT